MDRINRLKRGSELAQQYCASCHAFPEPRLLDKTTWEKDVLPAMGERLGINSFNGSYYRKPVLSDKPGATANQISTEDWDLLVEYYTTVAPWQPLRQHRDEPFKSPAPPLFTIHEPDEQMGEAPLASYVGMDTLHQRIWVADGQDSTLHIYNNRLEPLQQLRTASIVSDIILPGAFTGNRAYVTCLGTLYPSDALRGSIQTLQDGGRGMLPEMLKDHLPRPVQLQYADFNQDGSPDLLVCGFGYNNGALSWLELDTSRQVAVKEHIIFPRAGAIKAWIRDDNHDGRQDIWVLFAQGDESIWYFENTGNGNFTPQRILQFPPVYGSSSFTLQDIDHDGLEDIIYTCGDNADLSRILKPYHGVYIYKNKGRHKFVQQYFYPVNGCYKAIVKDFDLDGDEDMLTISFFGDYGLQPQEGLLYFENQGGINYTVYTLPASRLGHWICMDAGDIDGDGVIDVVLGNFSQGPANFPGMGSQWRNGPGFILLENTTRAARKKN
ncbi:MAG TPA: VCBS repeat-containing protein [Chitinophaga sp.]|uniref:FG-GAP repeat domain-containing protein n=1 Tax=Chitinophaga sp. TaxID=1869181 RepID=UPI002F924A93